MLLPPLSLHRETPSMFRALLGAASSGNVMAAEPLLELLKDAAAGASKPGEKPAPLSDVLGARRLEVLAARYRLPERTSLDDILYYLRVAQAFYAVEVFELTEGAGRLDEYGVRRTPVYETVAGALGDPRAALVYSLYVGAMLPTPARYAMAYSLGARSVREAAARRGFREPLIYNRLLAAQVEARGGGHAAWYEPLSDLSGIMALLMLLNLLRVKGGVFTLRLASKSARVSRMRGVYAQLLLPRATILLEYERLLAGGAGERLGIDYERVSVGLAKSMDWFRPRLPARLYRILDKLREPLQASFSRLEEAARGFFNMERVAGHNGA